VTSALVGIARGEGKLPHLDLVVVSTVANFGTDESLFCKLLRDRILPALMDWSVSGIGWHFLDVDIVLGIGDLDAVFDKFFVNLDVQIVDDATAQYRLLDPAK